MSTAVITLVVWLVLLFLSINEGIQKTWLRQMTSLNAPIQITPTDAYYNSYYYTIDAHAEASDYSNKTLGQKLASLETDPYNPEEDAEIPPYIHRPSHVRDLVKELHGSLKKIGTKNHLSEYEIGAALLKMKVQKESQNDPYSLRGSSTVLSQAIYLKSHDASEVGKAGLYLPLSTHDVEHMIASFSYRGDFELLKRRFFPFIEKLTFDTGHSIIEANKVLFADAEKLSDVVVEGFGTAGAEKREVSTPWAGMKLVDVKLKTSFERKPSVEPVFAYTVGKARILPSFDDAEPVLLPKSYIRNGSFVGDRGEIVYSAMSATSPQEQSKPLHVVGFYDPGIMNVGMRFAILPQEVVHSINSTTVALPIDQSLLNGYQLFIPDLAKTKETKKEIIAQLKNNHLDQFFEVKAFYEYDFAKELLGQFQSDQLLFTLVASIILLVACSNIITLLLLMVNDKKKEIGIMRSMGAKTSSIALIFGFAGGITGMLSGLLGTGLAYVTLTNLNEIVSFLSAVQGQPLFAESFYGTNLPSDMSSTALVFALIVTPLFSIIAGLIPAVKACRMNTSSILRGEG